MCVCFDVEKTRRQRQFGVRSERNASRSEKRQRANAIHPANKFSEYIIVAIWVFDMSLDAGDSDDIIYGYIGSTESYVSSEYLVLSKWPHY